MKDVIATQNLTRYFGNFLAVDHLTFSVQAGEVVGYLGPNGSGKTTTIRMLLGLLRPSQGSAQVLGYDIITQSEQIRARVEAARQIQSKRYQGSPYFCNAYMSNKDIREYCAIEPAGKDLLRQAAQRFSLSARAYTRILKLARTIADLEAAEVISLGHLAEAIQYRSLDRRGVG
jgi:predicted ATPase with chaperone activity